MLYRVRNKIFELTDEFYDQGIRLYFQNVSASQYNSYYWEEPNIRCPEKNAKHVITSTESYDNAVNYAHM